MAMQLLGGEVVACSTPITEKVVKKSRSVKNAQPSRREVQAVIGCVQV